MTYCFTARVLHNYSSTYESCATCGFLRAHEPHWLQEAYTKAITRSDTGLITRNIDTAKKLAGLLYWIFGERGAGHYIDSAGGYGILTRLMRDLGFDFYWNDKYCKNLFAEGFEYTPIIGDCQAVTAIEVLEHLVDPVSFIEEILSFSGAQTFLFTTELYKYSPPSPDAWNYYSFETGQHISFYKHQTLTILGKRLGFRFNTVKGIHIFTKMEINKHLLTAATSRLSSHITPWWTRHRLGSKTMSDSQALLRSL